MMSDMSRASTTAILVASIVALPLEAFVAFGLWFAPGWANGWGIPQREVWPVGLTGIAFVILFTAVVAGGALVSLCVESSRERTQKYPSWMPFVIWLWLGGAIAAAAVCPLYAVLRASAAEVWP
jgi:hypothetical protein